MGHTTTMANEHWSAEEINAGLGALAAAIGLFVAFTNWGKAVCRGVRRAIHNRLVMADNIAVLRQDMEDVRRQLYVADGMQKLVVDELELAVWQADVDGSCLAASDPYARLMGRDQAELVGWGWMGAIVESDRKRVLIDWEFSMKHRIRFASQYHVQRPDGSVLQVHSTAEPIRDASGQIVRYIGRVTVMEELRDS